jgi:hypothetical protein
MQDVHLGLSAGTAVKQRGHLVTNGLVISILHCGQMRTSSCNCSLRVNDIGLKVKSQKLKVKIQNAKKLKLKVKRKSYLKS